MRDAGGRRVGDERADRPENLLKPFLVAAGLVALAVAGVYAALPGSRQELWREDYLVENLSAVLYLAVFTLGLLALFALRRRDVRSRALAWLSVLGLLGFLEEASYGARLLHLRVPAICGHMIDAAHDIPDFGLRVLEWQMKRHGLSFHAWLAVLGAFLLVLAVIWRGRIVKAWEAVRRTPFRTLAALAGALVVLPFLLDLVTADSHLAKACEELLELLCSLALVFCVLQAYTAAGGREGGSPAPQQGPQREGPRPRGARDTSAPR
ncbi:MAG: hypothetical protein V1873_08045 [Verrucomicrobiota bacterium]